MDIGSRLRQLREMKKFSQGEVEKRTGLLRCYTSRVENGHTIPALETLQKYANAFEVQLYQLFIEDGAKAQPLIPPNPKTPLSKHQLNVLKQIASFLPKLDDRSIKLLLSTAKQMTK